MAPHSSTLAGKSHGWRSLVGCSPWGCKESDMTERFHFHFSLSCIGEGNGNPLQCSCLENPGVGEPGRLPSLGLHRVGHDWSDLAVAANCSKRNGYWYLNMGQSVLWLRNTSEKFLSVWRKLQFWWDIDWTEADKAKSIKQTTTTTKPTCVFFSSNSVHTGSPAIIRLAR